MRQRPVFGAVVTQDAKLAFFDEEREARKAHLTGLKGQRVGVLVETRAVIRSLQANNYYWGCVLTVMAKDQEMTPEDVHDAMCERFLENQKKRVAFFNKLTGEELAVYTDGRRSSKLSGTAFYDFVERVRLFALEFLGVVTEDPDPAYWRKRSAAKARGKRTKAA